MPSRPRRGRRTTALAAVALAVLPLAACGDEETGAKPDLPDEPPALWNPCDAIDAAFVERVFGSVAEERNGTATEPDCRFTPDEESGQPVLEANYQLFPAGLDAAWETMGQPHGAQVTSPRIPGAEDARVVVSVVEEQLYVTGFVQNGDLIQNVDVVDPAPYEKQRVVAAVREVLTAFSRHAKQSGVNAGKSPSGAPSASHP